MARKVTTVGIQTVREHFVAKGVQGKFTAEKARGRFPKVLVEEYEKETGHKVVTGFKAEKTVTLRPSKIQKNGKRVARPVQKSISEARALAGESAGARGVLGSKALDAASAALSDPLTTSEVVAAAAAVAAE